MERLHGNGRTQKALAYKQEENTTTLCLLQRLRANETCLEARYVLINCGGITANTSYLAPIYSSAVVINGLCLCS